MITQYTDDREQEKTNQEQDAQVKTKQCEVHTRKRDQAMKAAQVDPLKTQPLSQAQRMATDMPSVADKAVSTLLFFVHVLI
jgi:uncharacterized membrane protein YqiK